MTLTAVPSGRCRSWGRLRNERGGCFVAGTPVWTDRGPVPIEQIKVGDKALSQPEAGGKPDYRTVTRTMVRDDKEICCLRYVDHGRPDATYTIYPTGNHPFWVEGAGWTRADLVQGSDRLQLQDGRVVEVVLVSPVYRTSRPDVGWYNANSYLDDVGHDVDFSGAPRVVDFEAYRPRRPKSPIHASRRACTTSKWRSSTPTTPATRAYGSTTTTARSRASRRK